MAWVEQETEKNKKWAHIEADGPHKISDGLVIIRQGLSQQDQEFWVQYALDVGNDEAQGLWSIGPAGEKIPNLGHRGRVYDDIRNYQNSEKVQDLCHRLVNIARETDDCLPEMNPTHLLLNYYVSSYGMSWHSDDDPNDGDEDHPIVSISLGNSCRFGIELRRAQEEITLRSGDVLIWGGPKRMLKHAVLSINTKTSPPYLPLTNARINFTFRDAPSIIGKEEDWKIKKKTLPS